MSVGVKGDATGGTQRPTLGDATETRKVIHRL